jgi:hypothetical protein
MLDYFRRVYRALTGKTGDATDDVVWSNAAYPLAAFGAWGEPGLFALVLVTGTMLGLASAAYHSTYARWAQRADVGAMMTYLASVLACVLTTWTLWGLLLVPVAAFGYWRWTWQIDTQVHVPVWALAIVAALVVQVGWSGAWTLIPVAIGAVAQITTDSDSLWHSLWHLGGAASVAWVLALL